MLPYRDDPTGCISIFLAGQPSNDLHLTADSLDPGSSNEYGRKRIYANLWNVQ
jgi:hypothetical protein